MTDLQKKCTRFIRTRNLFLPGSRILIAVSGGMDSMALLDFFGLIRESWHLTLAAAHVQHGIRGKEAEEDEAFVVKACRGYGFPVFSVAVDAPSFCRMRGVSLETGARELRYSVLVSLADRLSYDWVAIAHQADDQAETILLNLIRGAGLRGMSGMLARRGRFIRPLLCASRREIEIYCRERSLPCRMDSTNMDTGFRRNRMRWRFLSILKSEFGEHVTRSICGAGDAVHEAETEMDRLAARAFRRTVRLVSPDEITLDIHQFLQYFKGVQKAILIRLFEACPMIGRRPGRVDMDRILWLADHGRSGSVFQPAPGLVIVKSGASLVFQRKGNGDGALPVEIGHSIVLRQAGIRFSSKIVHWKRGEAVARNESHVAFLDLEAAGPPYTLRFFRPGDRFIPLGMTGKKKLHDFFIDEKVPGPRRCRIPIFTANGRIAWVGGLRLDERFKVTKRTKQVLKLEIKPI